MLILTHNTYFFNVASMNRVVPFKGLYQLVSSSDCHELRSQGAFATPHLLQLKDVFDVSKGSKTANHTTPNSIRSVVESMWKFCRPDLQNFESFVRFLISDHNIEIKSVLINDLCHGGKFSDPLTMTKTFGKLQKRLLLSCENSLRVRLKIFNSLGISIK